MKANELTGFHKKDYKKIIHEIDKAKTAFKHEFNCSSTPWDSTSIDSVTVSDKNELLIWLNPNHQAYLNSGWYDVMDYKDWLIGKGPIVKDSINWEAFKLYCSLDCLSRIDYQFKHFLGHPKQYPRIGHDSFTKDLVLTKKDFTNKLTDNFIKAVEGYCKDIIYDNFCYMRDHYDINDFNDAYKNFDYRLLNNIILAHLNGFAMFGLLYSGACNTPAERQNKNWWNDIMISEGLWDIIKEKVLKDDQVKMLEELFLTRKY